jgi:hypothetical protein
VEFTTTNDEDEFGNTFAPATSAASGTLTATVSKVSVQYPADWYVVPAESVGQAWEWGAQSLPGATPRGTVAVGRQDGKIDAIGDEMTDTESSTSSWQVKDRTPVTVAGARTAERIDIATPLKGTDYQLIRILIQESRSSVVVVQIAAPAPIDPDLVTDLIDGIEVT